MPRPVADLGSTVCVLGMRVVLAYAGDRGVDVRALMAELGVDPAVLADPEHRLPLRIVHRAWDLAATRSHDPAFGLHVAERAVIGSLEALDYALWASETLEQVFERMARFHRVIGDDLAIELMRSGKWVRLRRVVSHDRRHRAESVLALVAIRARELCGRSFRLHEVRFTHHAPADVRPHRALFRCPVRFGCPVSELVFASVQLQLPVRTSKPGLATVLDRHLKDVLARLPQDHTFRQRVEHAIARTLHVGRPSLAATARAMHASRARCSGTCRRSASRIAKSSRTCDKTWLTACSRPAASRSARSPFSSASRTSVGFGVRTESGRVRVHRGDARRSGALHLPLRRV